MKITFKEIINSEAYQTNAQIYAKSMIFVSFITLSVIYFFETEATAIGAVILFLCWSLIGTAIIVAAPCYAIYALLITKMSEYSEFPSAQVNSGTGNIWKKIASIWNFLTYVINIYLTYFVAQKYWN
jgi:hypothetical protein